MTDPARRDAVDETRRRLATLAWFLDSAFTVPGSTRTFGVGPMIGLIPVVGDVVGAVAGGYLIFQAMRVGLPRIVLVRMTVNVVIDAAIGVVPFAGDAFDFVFKPNERNFRLFEQHALDPQRSTRGSWAFVVGLLAVAVLAMVAIALVAIALFQAFLDLFR